MAQHLSHLAWSDEAVSDLLFRGSKNLARHNRISVRTLRRRFNSDGISLRDLTRSKRAAVVLNLMQAGLPLSAIVARVGLSSPTALVRFVRREFGTTPARLAAQLREH